ncbi:hypothetical protein C1H76_3568 [Elsinoe australis]|uniref:Uncharacterized protein n=1 Tax=Elsinoe australis TaxID=40998 RepID=A0A2P7YJ54_9PEZI|nr:hypothetical protein B9Z65_5782 [Elsinoe australis]TKX24205.1 hypothetical protein C1H76_3568 [Elsinoe australis]
MRPTTPLSPRFDGSSRYDGLQASRQNSYQSRSPNSTQQRRKYGNNLMLPGLPRFHPANYPSSHSSIANTPASGPNSPHAPSSPGMQQNLRGESQRQMYAYQRETFTRTPSSQFLERPDSPRLQPLGSPGPVTPLELETNEGYLSVSKSPARPSTADQSEELAKKLAQAARQQKTTRVSSNTHRVR